MSPCLEILSIVWYLCLLSPLVPAGSDVYRADLQQKFGYLQNYRDSLQKFQVLKLHIHHRMTIELRLFF